MHNRQSGAAHVPMMFFLLLLVFFLGAVGFAWMNQTKNNELLERIAKVEAENGSLKAKSLLFEHYIKDSGDAVGKAGKYAGRASTEYNGHTLEGIEGVMSPEEITKSCDNALALAGQASAKGLEAVLGSLTTLIAQQKDRIRDIELARDEALATQAKTADELRKKSGEFEAKAKWYSDEIAKVRSELEASHSRTQATLTATAANVETVSKEKLAVQDAATQRETELLKMIDERNNRIAGMAQRETLRRPPAVADGTIIAARKGLPSAFINLGRKDLLQSGTIFLVRSPNSTSVKCKATVVSVGEDKSEVSLSDFADEAGDYARDGDQLYNDLYSPRMVRKIYLMGRFSAPYNKEPLANLLRRLGNTVVDKMAPGVDTVILGDDPLNEAGDGFARVADSAEFKQAVELKVEMVNLNTVRELIKL